MAGRRCSTCGVSYPSYPAGRFNKCLICGDGTDYFTNIEPDEDWEWTVEMSKKADLEKMEKQAVLLILPIPNIKATITEYDGRLWVPHQELIAGGYRNLEDFDIVMVEGTYYELQGHVGRYSRSVPGGAWWVEIVDLPEVTDEMLADFLEGGDNSGSQEEDADGDGPKRPEAPQDGLQ